MFFILSKTVAYLFMPTTIVVALLLAGIIIKKNPLKKIFLIAGLVCLLIFTNGFLADEFLRAWEVDATPMSEVNGRYDVAIVLAGITQSKMAPNDRIHLKKGADRVLHTAELYAQKRIRKILISGGSADIYAKGHDESQQLFQLFRRCGIPKRDLILEGESRNTHENAVYSARILKQHFKRGRFLLITSAFHMRRASGCFAKAGIEADVFSTDFYALERKYYFPIFFLPTDEALVKWTILTKEWIGFVAYKVMGYL